MWTILASTMQRLRMELTDLPSDIVRDIVIRVAKSSGGAADMARLICTCKTMYEFVEDIDVLKAVCFDRLVLPVHFNSLQKYESLLTRCAAKGNLKALYIFSKVILMTATQILTNIEEERPQDVGAMIYMRALLHGMFGDDGRQVDGSEFHINAVRFFLQICSPSELSGMQIHLLNYLEHFALFPREENEEFYESIDSSCRSVHWETLCSQLEQKGRDILKVFESRTGRTAEQWKPKTVLNESFFSMGERVDLLIKLWGSFREFVPGMHEQTQLRLDERVLQLCYSCYSAFIEDFKLIAISLDNDRLTAIGALDDAFPFLG
ncbi:hypothetical protein AKJ16_DCAP26265 [Drosera capensis]